MSNENYMDLPDRGWKNSEQRIKGEIMFYTKEIIENWLIGIQKKTADHSSWGVYLKGVIRIRLIGPLVNWKMGLLLS